jgi:hypothetical protein
MANIFSITPLIASMHLLSSFPPLYDKPDVVYCCTARQPNPAPQKPRGRRTRQRVITFLRQPTHIPPRRPTLRPQLQGCHPIFCEQRTLDITSGIAFPAGLPNKSSSLDITHFATLAPAHLI